MSTQLHGTGLRERSSIDTRWTWNLDDIFADWASWEAAYAELSREVEAHAAMQGSLGRGGESLLVVLRHSDALGQLAYRVWYFVSLRFDEDQRDNQVNARRQQVQALLARWQQATSWFSPELLTIPLATVREWMAASTDLSVYRFALEDVYRLQAHVLDQQGERLLALGAQFNTAPQDAYSALTTADMKFPTITLSTGESQVMSYSRYRAILATNREQVDRRAAFEAHHHTYAATANTYAALYHGILERDWFHARARHYGSTLDAALEGNNIPPAVVETLIQVTKAGTAPLRRYHRLRRRALGLKEYHSYDGLIPVVAVDKHYDYEWAVRAVVESVACLGAEYQREVREGFDARWIDVFENAGKRSGAYSAPVYGVHPYMLLNYNDTLDSVFTLAHEMGHSMHTVLSHRRQPFVYSDYTIFVAEVPSTLNEDLLLKHLLEQTGDPAERAMLLQHAIDGIVGTFYTQVMFADFELQAHRLVEQGHPITAETLGDLYLGLLKEYHGDALDYDELSRATWSRIPHFFQSPYYVYQYATCFASTAQIVDGLTQGSDDERAAALARYMRLLEAGGSDHPMTLLSRAGVDLARPDAVQAVVHKAERLVAQFEAELGAMGGFPEMAGGAAVEPDLPI